MNYRWSGEHKWNRDWSKHSVCTHFPTDPNCDICLKTKITRASCGRRAGTVVPRTENFGDLITAYHKVLSEGWQDRCAREAAWRLAKSALKLKEKNKATFLSPSENRCLPAATLKPEEREFVVDSGASMQMISKRTWILLKWILWRSRVVVR